MTIPVALIVGSLRKDSYSRAIGLALKELAKDRLSLNLVEIGDLPLYNPDQDEDSPPPAWTRLRNEVSRNRAVLFVTPEYNRSMPASIKNALDVGSRPYGHSVWAGKPAAIVSVSPGAVGGFGANHHLRQPLVFLDMPVLQQPEVYLGGVNKLLDEGGRLNNDGTRDFLKGFVDKFADWIDKTA